MQIFFECTNELLFNRNFDDYPHIKAWFDKMAALTEIKEVQEKWFAMVEHIKAMFADKEKA